MKKAIIIISMCFALSACETVSKEEFSSLRNFAYKTNSDLQSQQRMLSSQLQQIGEIQTAVSTLKRAAENENGKLYRGLSEIEIRLQSMEKKVRTFCVITSNNGRWEEFRAAGDRACTIY